MVVNNLHKYLNGRIPNPDLLCEFISDGNWSPATSNNIRRHLIALEKELQVYGYKGSIKSKIKKYRVTEQLHKPFKDVNLVFEEILSFDSRLYLCCLLAYGCLLRPHREIRLLKWEDFADDLSWVSLSGKMTKSKKNRVVPVPGYIKRILENYKTCHSQPCHNIFSGTSEPYNQYYFTTLWGRYKSKSMVLEGNQTLYSFRHTGAINVFQKTGSLTKLQYIMGHSTLQVSLTYLRFLEINKIDPKDMPDLNI